MTDLGKQVTELARLVQLVEVNPTATFSSIRPGSRIPPAGEQIDLSIDTKVGVVRTGETAFAVVARFNIRAKTKDASKPFARFSSRFFARYENAGASPDEVRMAFAQWNGMVHLWPYLRAHVQGASAQLGLVPITIPVFRAQPNAAAQPDATKKD
ncbi:MAG: hypothetical protein U0228_26915 [Myxococcaceae bacterium]